MILSFCDCGHPVVSFEDDKWECNSCGKVRGDVVSSNFRVVQRRPYRYALYSPEPSGEFKACDVPDGCKEMKIATTCDDMIPLGDLEEFLYGGSHKLVTLGRILGVRPGMRLSNTPNYMNDTLEEFLRLLDGKNQSTVARILNELDVTSASGGRVTNSHVSNCLRKAIFERGPAYSKPGYQGCNWMSFAK